MSPAISPENFFAAWHAVCVSRQTEILTHWENAPNYTAVILGNRPDSVVSQVAARLAPEGRLRSYYEYYSLDAVLYAEEDLLVPRPSGSTWLANVRVALEHENFFTSGLFQEVSHLLITRAELRVLVTYPEEYKIESEFDGLGGVIARSGMVDPAFLLITGKRTSDKTGVEWLGYTYQTQSEDGCQTVGFLAASYSLTARSNASSVVRD